MRQSLKNIDYLFSPRSVAVIGASNNPAKWGFGIMSRLVRKKTSFKVYPINPKEKEIPIARLTDLGIFTYRSPEVGAKVIAYLANYGRYLNT